MVTANRKKRKTTPRHTGAWVLVLTLFIVELFFYTWCRVQCVQIGIAIGQEDRKMQELSVLKNSLNVELARLKAPERISHIARRQLSLELPEPRQVIMVP